MQKIQTIKPTTQNFNHSQGCKLCIELEREKSKNKAKQSNFFRLVYYFDHNHKCVL